MLLVVVMGVGGGCREIEDGRSSGLKKQKAPLVAT